MKLSAFIMADKSQSVEIPVPGEPVECTISISSISLFYHMINGSTGEEEDGSTSRIGGTSNLLESRELYGYDYVPVNFGGGNGGNIDVTIYPSANISRYYTDMIIRYVNGSFSVNVSGLSEGNYIFESVLYLGLHEVYWYSGGSIIADSSGAEVINSKNRVIKGGSNGVIDILISETPEEYIGRNSVGCGRVISTRIRYAFTVVSGDTTKTFTFGSNADMSLSDICSGIKVYNLATDGVTKGSVFANTVIGWRSKVYKSA